MKTSAHGRAFLIEQEGKSNLAYPDPVTHGKPWTIGVGHCGPDVIPGLYWSDAQIDATLAADLAKWERVINDYVTVPLSQNQFDSLISLCHNIGPTAFETSTLLRLLNAGDYDGAADQFERWDMASGQHQPSLHARRLRERALFLMPDAVAGLTGGTNDKSDVTNERTS